MLRHCLAASLLVLVPATTQAQLRAPRRTFVAPGRLYAFEVPVGCTLHGSDKDADTLELRFGSVEGDASLYIRRMKVPKGASPRQLLLNALEQRLSKLPAFREAVRKDVKVAGSPAAVIAGSYAYQGNAQFPRTVEDLFIVRGEEAFIFHFDAFEPVASQLAPGLEVVYSSFAIHPPGAGAEGKAPPPGMDLPIDIDKIAY